MPSELLLHKLIDHAVELDRTGAWPAEQLDWLANEGILGRVIPLEFGGSDVSEIELMRIYQQLAEACLSTTFILTQRNGACQRIAGCGNIELKHRLLPDLASGKTFATVGISHLTTSRQHMKTPAVRAELRKDEIRLHGSIPWVTGAAHAQHIVTGGTCDDGRQMLIALPTDISGVRIRPHVELMALTASHTASVDLDQVSVPADCLIAGPVEGVMKQGAGGGAGSLTTSALAAGLAARSEKLLLEQAALRADLCGVSNQFGDELRMLQADLEAALTDLGTAPRLSSSAIRHRANSLALRITQAALAVCKGAGYARGHAAELAAREAMFFLVWSCPQPVVQGVLEELSCRDPGLL